MITTTSATATDLFITMALDAWKVQVNRFDQFLASMTSEDLAKEIAPGKNTGTYLLGHLAAVADAMLPLMGLREKLYPQYFEPFVVQADKSGHVFPPVEELKAAWQEISTAVYEQFSTMDTASWLGRHTSVSEEDFAKEPHRNKLNVLLSRTSHQAYHFGQMILLSRSHNKD